MTKEDGCVPHVRKFGTTRTLPIASIHNGFPRFVLSQFLFPFPDVSQEVSALEPIRFQSSFPCESRGSLSSSMVERSVHLTSHHSFVDHIKACCSTVGNIFFLLLCSLKQTSWLWKNHFVDRFRNVWVVLVVTASLACV